MNFEDLLFYLYPVALEYSKDKCFDAIDGFMYSLDRYFPLEASKLPKEDYKKLIEGLRWIWDSGDLGYADWIQCANLQKAIGISVSWDDL